MQLPLSDAEFAALFRPTRLGQEMPARAPVLTDVIEPELAARVYGQVRGPDGAPLQGIRVRELRHAEFGYTASRADGRYDLVVNGGTSVTLVFEHPDFITVHRAVRVGTNDHAQAVDVVMTAYDLASTSISFGGDASAPPQIHRATVGTDVDGTRRPTLLVQPGTVATAVLSDGSRVDLPNGTVRATEFTLGASRDEIEARMPALMPDQIALTHAVEFSIDEAEAMEARTVEFDRPVLYYLENFMGLPAGAAVPVGSYDRHEGRWVPEPNGHVIDIVGVDVAGLAEIDVDGDGVAEPWDTLDDYQLYASERRTLAELYPGGGSIWRSPTHHFTPVDHNLRIQQLSEDARAPDAVAQGHDTETSCEATDGVVPESSENAQGSIIHCRQQHVTETFPIAGTGLSLVYRSDRSADARHLYEIEFDSFTTPGAIRTKADIVIGGQRFERWDSPPEYRPDDTIDFGANGRAVFVWDGNDFAGRRTPFPREASVTVCAEYESRETTWEVVGEPIDASPTDPELWTGVASFTFASDRFFGRRTTADFASSLRSIPGTSRANVIFCREQRRIRLGTVDPTSSLGNLELSNGLRVDALGTRGHPTLGRDFPMDRSLVSLSQGRYQPEGGSLGVPLADGVPFIDTAHYGVETAFSPNGTLYVADATRIYRVNHAGTLEHIGGNGGTYGGTPLPLFEPSVADVSFAAIHDLEFGADGSLYVVDGNSPESIRGRIRRVSPTGAVHLLVGGGGATPIADGVPGTAVDLYVPSDLSVSDDGELYFISRGRIWSMGADGTLRRVSGHADTGGTRLGNYVPDEVPLGTNGGAVLEHCGGSLFVSDRASIYRLGEDGILRRMLGQTADVSPARVEWEQARATAYPRWSYRSVDALECQPDGSSLVFRTAYQLFRFSFETETVERILGPPSGLFSPQANQTFPWNGLAAPDAGPSFDGHDLSLSPTGGIVFQDTHHLATHLFRAQRDTARPLFTPSGGVVGLDAFGRVASFASSTTGDIESVLSYGPAGELVSIVDASADPGRSLGRELRVQYDPGGYTVVAPFGERTRVDLDARARVVRVGYPDDASAPGADYLLTYRDDTTLLTRVVDRRGMTHQLDYDGTGRLVADRVLDSAEVPVGGWNAIVRSRRQFDFADPDDSFGSGAIASDAVILQSSGSARTTYREERYESGERRRSVEYADGTQQTTEWSDDRNHFFQTQPDGSVVETVLARDPAFGLLQHVPRERTLTLPSGASLTSEYQGSASWSPVSPVLDRREDTITVAGRSSRTLWERVPGDGLGPRVTSTSPSGRQSVQRFDEQGRLVRSEIPGSGLAPLRFTYDDLDRVVTMTLGEDGDADRRVTHYDYTENADNGLSDGDAERAGPRAIRDALGRQTSVRYDGLGRAFEATGTGGEVVSYRFDPHSNLLGLTPPARSEHLFSYDEYEGLASYEPPAVTSDVADTATTHARGADRFESGTTTLPGGNTLTPTYARGRMTSLDFSLGTIDYGFAPLAGRLPETDTGQLRSLTMPQVAFTGGNASAAVGEVDYDGPLVTEIRARLSGLAGPAAGGTSWSQESALLYTHDANDGLRLRQFETRIDGARNAAPLARQRLAQRYTYDDDGLLTELQARRDGTLEATVALDHNGISGLLDSFSVNVGDATTSDSILRNPFGEPEIITTAWDGSSVRDSLEFGYSFDAIGRIASRTERTDAGLVESQAYHYDAAGRLARVDVDGVPGVYRYAHDPNGSRIGWDSPGALVPSCDESDPATIASGGCVALDAQDRLTRYGPAGSAIEFEYNLRGQMSARTFGGARTEYDYDELGHLRQVRLPNGTELTYLIDSAGRRAAKLRDGVPERLWVYQDGLNPIAELDGDGNVRAWFIYTTKAWVPDYAITPDGHVYRVVSDQVGSVRAVVDVQTGVTVQSYAYSPYGRVVASNVQRDIVPFRFAGGLFDQDTELYRFGARDYDPEVGRWTAKDPIGFGGGTTNLFEYAGGDPINGFDVNGLEWDLAFANWLDRNGVDDFAAGFGDWTTGGLTGWLRQQGGFDGTVDRCSGAYDAGEWAAVAVAVVDGAQALAMLPSAIRSLRALLVSRGSSGGLRPFARSLGAAGDDLLLRKAVNSNLPHAIQRGVERGVFSSVDEAGAVLRELTEQITRTGTFPSGTLVDTARSGRFLVPVGTNGRAVYQLGRNGTAKLKTVLISR